MRWHFFCCVKFNVEFPCQAITFSIKSFNQIYFYKFLIFFEISQKFSKYLGKPTYILFCFKNKSIFNHVLLSENLSRSLGRQFRYFNVTSIYQFGILLPLVIWNIFFEWEMAELDCFWHRTELLFCHWEIDISEMSKYSKKYTDIFLERPRFFKFPSFLLLFSIHHCQ